MRAVILADPVDNQKAGIHYYTKNLLENLGRVNSSVEYHAIFHQKHPEIQNIAQHIINPIAASAVYRAFRMFYEIPSAVKKINADMVIEPAHFGPFNLPDSIKRVTVIHDLTPVLFPQYHVFYSQVLQGLFLKSILKKANLIICNSKHTRDDVLNRYPFTENKTEYIYLGRDAIYHPVKDYAPILKEYNIDSPYILFVGTIEPRKNLETLLYAHEALLKQGYDIELVIAGQKGWKSSYVLKIIENHKYREKINIPGYVDKKHLPALFSGALAYVQPSRYEGFGLPVVEAMSCGTPCIVADNSSLPEVGGEAALRFKTESSEALMSKIKLLSDDPTLRKSLKTASLEQSAQFSWKEHAETFDQLIQKTLAK